ncbi:hypothetical protein C9Z81_09860, partial [Escherichia coli]
ISTGYSRFNNYFKLSHLTTALSGGLLTLIVVVTHGFICNINRINLPPAIIWCVSFRCPRF